MINFELLFIIINLQYYFPRFSATRLSEVSNYLCVCVCVCVCVRLLQCINIYNIYVYYMRIYAQCTALI